MKISAIEEAVSPIRCRLKQILKKPFWIFVYHFKPRDCIPQRSTSKLQIIPRSSQSTRSSPCVLARPFETLFYTRRLDRCIIRLYLFFVFLKRMTTCLKKGNFIFIVMIKIYLCFQIFKNDCLDKMLLKELGKRNRGRVVLFSKKQSVLSNAKTV